MTFAKWLKKFLEEKGIDSEEVLTVEGPSGQNLIPVGCLADLILAAPASEIAEIKGLLVRIDCDNKNVRHCLTHIARRVAR